MPDDALIHLRVPAALKARWVRESRAAGMRLTDWIVSRVEERMRITIPGIPFSALQLCRDADGEVSFNAAAVAQIAEASGLPADYFAQQHEDAVADLIVQWYRAHLAAGGERDPTADDLIVEAGLEDQHGAGMSHQPGRA